MHPRRPHRPHRPLPLAALVAVVALVGCVGGDGSSGDGGPPPAENAADAPDVQLEQVLSGLDQPVLLTHAPGQDALIVVEQPGRILAYGRAGGSDPVIMLDVRAKVLSVGEQGLLGFAFHPEWRANRMAFVSYTDVRGDSVLARYRVTQEETLRLDPASEEVLLRVDQPYGNHNGGHVAFGPDGLLYYGLGDGGSAGDPQGNGQDPHALLGSILRLDVDAPTGYRVPPDNPYATGEAGAALVWAKGLRNPWRFSFDRATGDLYIGDVGQNAWEEIDFLPARHEGGANFGWAVYEGNHRYRPIGRPFSDVTFPVHEYALSADRCAVTGGYAYRGSAAPALNGTFLFGDYCSGEIWGLQRDAAGEWRAQRLMDTALSISSFGEDDLGELYVVDRGGSVHRIRSTPTA